MSRKDLASVLIGVTGLFVIGTRLAEALFYVPFLIDAATWSGDPAVMYAGLLTSVLVLGVGAVLTVFRDPLATWLFRSSTPPASATSARDWQAVGFSLVGLYFLIRGIAGVAASWGRSDPQSYAFIILGFAAFLGANGLSNLWQLLRTSGRVVREPAAQQAAEPDV